MSLRWRSRCTGGWRSRSTSWPWRSDRRPTAGRQHASPRPDATEPTVAGASVPGGQRLGRPARCGPARPDGARPRRSPVWTARRPGSGPPPSPAAASPDRPHHSRPPRRPVHGGRARRPAQAPSRWPSPAVPHPPRPAAAQAGFGRGELAGSPTPPAYAIGSSLVRSGRLISGTVVARSPPNNSWVRILIDSVWVPAANATVSWPSTSGST
jgi:hypothetical protein